MKFRFSKFPFNFLFAFVLLASLLGGATPAQAAEGNTALPVERLLNADGTLDLSAGYSGELDITNFDISLDPALGPVFKPLAVPNTWNALGDGVNSFINAIAISGTDVYAGGEFLNAGYDINADYIAKWNGSAWSALGATPLNNFVYAITVSGTDVYAGGAFVNAGNDINADYIAKWDGSAWSALGATPLNNFVYAVAVSGADVYAGGEFTDAGGDANADYIAKFSGSTSTWSALGATPLSDWVYAVAVSGADVYAGGGFFNAGGDANADFIAKFSGGAWSALGATPLNEMALDIVVSGTDVYASGQFTNAGGDANADYIAKWNGSAWSALGVTPLNNRVYGLTVASGGDVYAGGLFTDAGGDVNADYIAKWSGSTWSALGATPLNSLPVAIAVSGGDVYAGGQFTNAGGNGSADYIARFETPSATITVNTATDELNSDGDCSLREAIEAANTNAAVDACAAGTGLDTIVFDGALGSAVITLGSSLQSINGGLGLIIDGGGDVSVSGNDLYRPFTVAPTVFLTLQNITVEHGNASGAYGGGLANDQGQVTIANSAFLNNAADASGGVDNAGGTVIITNSTFYGNSATAGDGGGFYNYNGTATVINSTFSNNSSFAAGSGIKNQGDLNLYNTIIANSTNGDGDCSTNTDTVTALNNLIESAGSLPCDVTSASDPNLGLLTGSPAYLPLNPGSPAIDAGDDATCAAAPVNNASQNGRTRPQGAHCDVGSVESNATLTLRSVGGNDGFVLESTETSGVGGTMNSAAAQLYLGDNAANRQYRAILSFNTASLPDNAIITKVSLKFKHIGFTGTSPFTTHGNLIADIRKGPLSANSALQLNDFKATASKNGVLVYTSATVSNWYIKALNAVNFQYIHKLGITQFRLRFKTDDNNDLGADFLKIYSGNAGAANRPQLVIEYYVP
ncbi:MAG: choice-of-anchor Q domain-containing protein [Chloroflexota bacterium]